MHHKIAVSTDWNRIKGIDSKATLAHTYIYETPNIEYLVYSDNKKQAMKTARYIQKNYDDIADVQITQANNRLYRIQRIREKRIVKQVLGFKNFAFVLDPDGEYTNIHNQKCRKEYYYNNYYLRQKPRDTVFELDVSLSKRYRIELAKQNKLKLTTNYRTLFFDIETNKSLDIYNAPKEIISISTYDTLKDETLFWCITKQKPGLGDKFFDTEEKMLRAFCSYMQEFDVVVGWNILHFDIPYLLNRLDRLHIGRDTASIVSNAQLFEASSGGKKRLTGKIAGIHSIDLIPIAKMFTYYMKVKPDSLRLDDVAGALLGTKKIKLESSPGKLWEDNKIQTLKKYNNKDTILCVKLSKKLGLTDYVFAIKSLVPAAPLENCIWNSKIVDAHILSSFGEKVFPTASTQKRDDKLIGATTLKPIHGLYESVAVFDFASMYPSIIKTFNISTDTKDKDGSIQIGETNFTDNKKGVLPKVIEHFTGVRQSYKEKLRKSTDREEKKFLSANEQGTKVIVNSIYGVTGYSRFRLYDSEVCNAITRAGREMLAFTIGEIQKKGYTVLYGDTDSVFVWHKNKDKATKQKYNELCKNISDNLTDYVRQKTVSQKIVDNHSLKLEFETLFDTLLMCPSKKKYVGLASFIKGNDCEQELYFKGVELRRRDTPAFFKECISSVIKLLLKTRDYTEIRKELKRLRNQAKNQELSSFLIYKDITRHFNEYKVKPQHVRAAEYSNKYLGQNFSRSNYQGGVLYVKVHNKYPKTDTIFVTSDFELPKEMSIDYDRYFKKFMYKKLELLMGEEAKKIVRNRDLSQTALGDFC